MPKLTKQELMKKLQEGRIKRREDILLYEEIESLKQEVEEKLKMIDEMLKSDKIFKDLFYSARGQEVSENLLDKFARDLFEYLKSNEEFVASLQGKDAEVDYERILKEVLKNIRQPKDGQTPIIDYKKIIEEVVKRIPKPEAIEPPDVSEIAVRASEMAREELLSKIPTIPQITEQIPLEAEKIRDALEVLVDEKRLDKSAIKGLEEYATVARLDRAISILDQRTQYLVNKPTLKRSNLVDDEIPSGTINGSNTDFTLVNTPTSGSTKVYLNGVRQQLNNEYTVSGNVITFLTAPVTGSKIYVDYKK